MMTTRIAKPKGLHAFGVTVFASLFAANCSWGERKSVDEAELQFVLHREAYQALAEAALESTEPRSAYPVTQLSYVDPTFDGLEDRPPYRSLSVPSDGSPPAFVRITLFSYGNSISGRNVGLIYYSNGEIPANQEETYLFLYDSCGEMILAEQSLDVIQPYASCDLGGGWIAYRESY